MGLNPPMGRLSRRTNTKYAKARQDSQDMRIDGKHVSSKGKQHHALGRFWSDSRETGQNGLGLLGIKLMYEVKIKLTILLLKSVQNRLDVAASRPRKPRRSQHRLEAFHRGTHHGLPCGICGLQGIKCPTHVPSGRVLRKHGFHQNLERVARENVVALAATIQLFNLFAHVGQCLSRVAHAVILSVAAASRHP